MEMSEPHPPKPDAKGYWYTQWRDAAGQHRKTFGNESKVCKAAATRAWRNWMARKDLAATEGNPVDLLVAEYNKRAEDYYRANGELTGEHYNISAALAPFVELFGDMDANALRPRHLIEYQDHIAGWVKRTTQGKWSSIVKRMLKWAVVQEYVSESVAGAMMFVVNPQRGRTKAAEPDAVKPVGMRVLAKTLGHLSPAVGGMVRLQWWTGMRPGEVCRLTPEHIDRSRETWLYAPEKHKGAHREHQRVIALGPKSRKLLRPLLFKSPCFQTTYGTPWTTRTYGDAIEKACKRAGVEVWTPNQIRHAAADRADRKGGDDARVLMGHKDKKTTKIYITEDVRKLMILAERAG